MRGFQPRSAAGAKEQRFADGGFVQGIKRAFGMDEERNAQIAAYRARAAAEKAQQQAQAQQQTPQPQQRAVTQYSGMSATQRREKELGLADGGRVRPRGFVSGKGTATSDSIPARLSNGEYVLPADTVRAVGVEALDALRESTHKPVKGEQSKAARGFFAGGTPGGVGAWFQDQQREQEQRKQEANAIASEAMAQSQTESDKPAAQSSRPAEAAAPVQAAPTPAAKDPLDGGAVFGLYPQLAGGQRTTYATDAKLRTGVQATGPSTFAPATPSERTIIGGGNGQRMNAAQDPRSLTYGATAGNDTAAPVAPAAPNPTDQRIAAGAQQAPAAATQPASAMVAPGAYRNAPGQYSDNAAGMAMPAGFTGQPSAQNMAAADALAARQTPAGFQPAGSQPASVQAPVVRNSTNDWAARKALANAGTAASSITNTRRWGGKGAENSPDVQAYQAMLRNDLALQQAQIGLDQTAMRENAGITREGMQQAGATTRTGMTEQGANARDARRNALTAEELALRREAAGFQTRAAKRRESAYDSYSKAKTDEDRQAIAKQFPDLFGQAKDAAHRMEVVRGKTDPMTGQSSGDYVVVQDPKTGEVRQIQMGAAPAPQAMPKPASKAEFDALPKGTRFTDPNGQVRIK